VSIARQQVALSEYTTLGLGGPARRLVDADDDEQAVAVITEADRAGEPVLVLGGGSNLVVADEGFPGTVVRIVTTGISAGAAAGDIATVTVAAGENWDRLVEWTVAEGLAGVECLAGIPGLTGATPVQNVGAYGQEVAQTIVSVRALDRQRGEVVTLSAAQCEFAYRMSMLKRAAAGLPTGRYVVLGVTFGLSRGPAGGPALSAPVGYAELARRLAVATGDRVPLAEARTAVLALRRSKGMVLDAADPDTRSAGSFFTNPILSPAQFDELGRRAAARCGPDTAIPHFPAGDEAPGAVKVPAAWLIERAGFTKGYPAGGRARISAKHTLALTNPGGASPGRASPGGASPGKASTADLLGLAREIADGVQAAFGVALVNEPVLIGVKL
jgi:UDP-N-acetylmuramate dehydrogenase